MLTYLLWSCSGMLFKLPDQDVTSTCCRGWHLLVGPKKILTVAGWFSLLTFTWNLFYFHQAECDWDDVNVTLCKCCLLFLCVRQTHRNCCLELFTTLLTASFPSGLYSHCVTDYSKWKPLLMTPEEQLQHNKPRLEVLPSSIRPVPWIHTALTGTQACRAARGWKGRTRTCTRWNLVFPFPDHSHYAAP